MPHPNGPLAEMGDGYRATSGMADALRGIGTDSTFHGRTGVLTEPTHEDHDRRIASVGPTILLSTGRYFDFTNPTPLTEQEVAHALANICRFTGHCRQFYSVAQHSVLVSLLVPREMAMWGLLHDAVEAVVGDMAGPLKRLMPEYKALEDRCERVILAGFGLDVDAKPPEVKRADLVALRTEQRDLMHRNGGLWTCLDGIEPPEHLTIKPWTPGAARRRFLIRYRELQATQAELAADWMERER